MTKIKIHTKERIVVDYTYETTDGKIFTDESVAIHHQGILDGTRISCPLCKGAKGKTQDFGDYGYTTNLQFVNCEQCQGRGYLELKFA